MNLSRGTGFVELYLKTDSLSATDWDVLAEGLKWSYQAFPTFKRVRDAWWESQEIRSIRLHSVE